MTNLELGTDPDPLVVTLVMGDPFEASLVLSEDDVITAWPTAPVLLLNDGTLTLTATLGPDDTAVANAKATWNATDVQVLTLANYNGAPARMTVDDVTWFRGVIRCLS